MLTPDPPVWWRRLLGVIALTVVALKILVYGKVGLPYISLSI